MSETNQENQPLPNWIELVQKHIASIKFGNVQLVIHESKVVQIETTEKVRFEKTEPKPRH